jgi:hypothetical protein
MAAGEQPRLADKGNSAQLALGRIVAQADAAILEEAREHVDAFEHVIHGLRHLVVARELAPLPFHPFDEIIHQRRIAINAGCGPDIMS